MDKGTDTENEVPINETLRTGADNVNENREGHEVETTELNKKRNKRRKNTRDTENPFGPIKLRSGQRP